VQENNMLMEQVSLQDDEINAMKKELADRDQHLQTMEQNFSEATAAIQELRDSCVHLRDEKQHCEKQLQHYAATIAQLENTKDHHTQRIEAAHMDKSTLENQLAEYETLLSNAKKNALRKDEQYSTRYQNVCSRLRDLNGVIESKDKQLEEALEKVSVLQAEIDAVRQDCEGMLNVMNSMEKQLNQYSDREDAVAEVCGDGNSTGNHSYSATNMLGVVSLCGKSSLKLNARPK
jgi:chromosome segregation ATPase